MLARLRIRPELLHTDGDLHGGTVTPLADAVRGIGSVARLPEGAARVATIELKTNLLRTVRDGTLVCERTPAHGGQTTQVWDARVWHEGEIARPAALFRRTQLLLPGERG